MPSLRASLRAAATLLCLLAPSAPAQFTLAPESSTLTLDQGLIIDGVAQTFRRPINTDAIIARIADGTFNPAAAAPGVELIPGHAWQEIHAQDGAFNDIRPGAYILMRIQCPAPRIMILDASTHAMVYINGEPRMGDPYGLGYVSLPIQLRQGDNTLLFAARRGMRASLRTPPAELFFSDRDLTLPDLRPGSPPDTLIGIPIINASAAARTITIRAESRGHETLSSPFTLPPLSITKLPLTVRCEPAPADTTLTIRLSALERSSTLAGLDVTLNVIAPSATHKRTFTSRIDGSTQYLSIIPPADASPSPGLVLSLHGASVEATSQAGAYAAKPGLVIACPTNRRPFGFDWEDWGRIDALEAMDLVHDWYHTDPTRQYLTGHSMGGHGTWNLGVLCADRFAAIAPSAGWLTFDSYTGGGQPHSPDSTLGKAFQSARASSMTVDFFPNLRGKGIFILHGDADDNVPVAQARAAREALDALAIPFAHHEQPGAGHWWDDDNPGAACVDWPGIWETFAASTLDPAAPLAVQPPLDSRGFATGSFKRVFDHTFVLVYSTSGTSAENAWSFAKARYDAEQWWYRGNGYAPIMSDADFVAAPTPGNVILYGNAETNLAWPRLIDPDSLHLLRGRLTLDGKTLEGDDLACLAALPRRDFPGRLIGIVGGTGLRGMRTTERLGYFTSGIGFPEIVIMRTSTWTIGFEAVEAAGPLGATVWK